VVVGVVVVVVAVVVVVVAVGVMPPAREWVAWAEVGLGIRTRQPTIGL
jgi:hypothetical protein